MNPIPDFVEDVLKEWEAVAYFAYDGYERQGRGVVTVEPDAPGSVRFMYGPAEFFERQKQKEVTHLLAAYDPVTEFLAHFQDSPAATRTIRIRTPDGGRDPKCIWFFRMLARAVEQPGAVPDYLPEWFFHAFEKLEVATKEGAEPSCHFRS